MNSSSETAMATAGELKEKRLQAAKLTMDLADAEYRLSVTRARVERALIKRVKGEKALGPTSEDRNRIFTLALDADPDYQIQLKDGARLRLELEGAKAEMCFLQDKLRIMLAAMRSAEDAGSAQGQIA
jgi:hypothetical protein